LILFCFDTRLEKAAKALGMLTLARDGQD